jgi:hypothetical protein
MRASTSFDMDAQVRVSCAPINSNVRRHGMRSRFLTIYDYGTGGVWQFFSAESAEQILSKYPQLKVIDTWPTWLTEDESSQTRTYDIDAPPDSFLVAFVKEPPA